LQRFGLIIFLLAALVSAVKVISLTNNPEIKLVNSEQVSVLYPKDQASIYQAAASKLISESVLNNNKLTFDDSGISRNLLTEFPQIVSAYVSIPFTSDRPIIYIEQASPALILIEKNGAFVLDYNGRAMFKSQTVGQLDLSNIPVITDQGGLVVTLGEQVLPSTDITFTKVVLDELAAKSYSVSNINLPPGSNELDIGIKGQPYYVKFNLQDNDPREQAGTFLATINNLNQQHITPTKYVDVRIDGRAYYL